MEKKKVLVVDDDATILEMLKSGLELLGYCVETADSPYSVQDLLGKSRPDIILMDVGMPGIDGISLCRNLHRTPDTFDIPVIMVTAFSDESTFHDALLFGAADYITKPFEIFEVQKKIDNCIAKADAKRENKS